MGAVSFDSGGDESQCVAALLASRVARTANTVNVRATNVHSQTFPFSSLVAVSSMFSCSCAGSSAANASVERNP